MTQPGIVDHRVVHVGGVRAGETVNRRVQQDILLAGQLRVKPRAQLDHAADAGAARDEQRADGRPMNPRHQLQERALPGAVAADEPHGLSLPDLQRNRCERPELLDALAAGGVEEAEQPDLQLARWIVSEVEPLGDIPRFEDRWAHRQMRSAKLSSYRTISHRPTASATTVYVTAIIQMDASGQRR
jgi:hypothetical protein